MKKDLLYQKIKVAEELALSKMNNDKFRQGYHLMP